MDYLKMYEEVKEAESTIRNCDRLVNKLISLCIGRLKKVRPDLLHKLKKELKDFNATTYTWKS